MSDLGSFSFRFHETTNSLRDFDSALRYLRQRSIQGPDRTREEVAHLLRVLKPVTEVLNGTLSGTAIFDEQFLVSTLRQRSTREWQLRRTEIIELTQKLMSGKYALSANDLSILNDVADAMGTECASLFRRIGGRS